MYWNDLLRKKEKKDKMMEEEEGPQRCSSTLRPFGDNCKDRCSPDDNDLLAFDTKQQLKRAAIFVETTIRKIRDDGKWNSIPKTQLGFLIFVEGKPECGVFEEKFFDLALKTQPPLSAELIDFVKFNAATVGKEQIAERSKKYPNKHFVRSAATAIVVCDSVFSIRSVSARISEESPLRFLLSNGLSAAGKRRWSLSIVTTVSIR